MPDIIKDLNLNKNELKNAVVETAPSLSSAPSSPRKNQIYFNSTNNILYRYNGTTWVADNKVGQIYFNTSDNNLYRYNGSNWVTYQAPITTTTATAIEIPNGILKGSSGSIIAATAGTDYQAPLPSQTGNSGKFLTTNGNVLSWADASLPPYYAEFSTLQGIDEETVSCDTSISSLIQMFGERPVYGVLDGAIFQLILVDSNSIGFQLQSDAAIITIIGTINQSTDVWEIYYLYLQQQITFDGTYNASTNKAATQSTITNAINALDGGTIGTGSTTKTITSLSQTNGNVSATFNDIAFPVTSVNTKTGAVSLTAADVGAATSSDISTAINALDGSITGTAGAGKTLTAFSQTNGKVSATFGDISITKSQVSDFPTIPSPADANPLMDGTAAVGSSTDYAREDHVHPSDTSKISTSAIGAANGVAPLNVSRQIDSSYLPSDIIEGYYNSTTEKFYEESTYTTEITPEAEKIYIDLSTNIEYRYNNSSYVNMSRVTQTKAAYSGYTYWRPVPLGSSTSSSATGAFSTITNTQYTFDNLRYQPSTGTLRTKIFNVAPTVAGTTASNNHMSSDSVNNIWFRVNNGVDTVLTLYSNGTDRTVRPGGSYAGLVDLGTETVPWRNLYLSGEIYNNPPSTTVASGDKILVNDTSTGTISSGITLGSSTTQYLANDGSWQNIPTVPTNCEVTVTHIVGTWNVDTTYATMVAAHNAGGIVYFTYGSYTAIASFHTSNTVTANIMYMDSEGIYQMQITVNSSDEVDCAETNYTFPTIYNGETS